MHALLIASLLFAAMPYGERRIAVGPGEALAVTIQGSGPTVAIVPGLIGGAFGFRHVAAGLVAAGRTVVIVNLLGLGGSSRSEDADYSAAAQAARVAAALDALNRRGTMLVMHAASGAVGFRLALARPDLVSAIVSINAGPGERFDTPGVTTALRFSPLLRVFGAEGRARDRLVDGLREASHDPAWVTDSVIDAYAADYGEDLWGTLRTFQRMSRARDPEPLQPSLDRLDTPVMLLRSAERPQSIPEDHVAVLEQRVRLLTIENVPRAGQYIHEERPEVVIEAVLRMSTARSAIGATTSPTTR